jgi:1-acyl-sn-glycerol-3-phosphate acyltransferase
MLKSICTLIFKLSGWKYESHVPDELRSFILIGAPHTSNYDFIPAMAINKLMNRNTKFIIKKDWLKFPLNLIMKPAGAIGIDRKKIKLASASSTDIMADLFKNYPELVLMISPEGTRGANPNWKTGFYYIAQKAKVPIVLGFADFPRKVAGIGLVIYPSDFEKDMKLIMDFYKDVKGCVPENFMLDPRFVGQ